MDHIQGKFKVFWSNELFKIFVFQASRERNIWLVTSSKMVCTCTSGVSDPWIKGRSIFSPEKSRDELMGEGIPKRTQFNVILGFNISWKRAAFCCFCTEFPQSRDNSSFFFVLWKKDFVMEKGLKMCLCWAATPAVSKCVRPPWTLNHFGQVFLLLDTPLQKLYLRFKHTAILLSISLFSDFFRSTKLLWFTRTTTARPHKYLRCQWKNVCPIFMNGRAG